ncbi:hypothetical protein OUZ56_024087 [Daphnia magna]|uniref:Uncharacterized protein n=1 Tax=Daphnia magna TaxID=35525 RepID=A0ABR0B041_9CRUS|nr:hypothetical protein OUZ56_024087 [Daphnia magna]
MQQKQINAIAKGSVYDVAESSAVMEEMLSLDSIKKYLDFQENIKRKELQLDLYKGAICFPNIGAPKTVQNGRLLTLLYTACFLDVHRISYKRESLLDILGYETDIPVPPEMVTMTVAYKVSCSNE